MTDLPAYLTGIVAVLLISSFVRFATVFTIVRYALGLHGWTFGCITSGLALVLSVAVMSVQLPGGGVNVFDPQSVASVQVEKTFRPFLEKQTDPEILSKVTTAVKAADAKPGDAAPFSFLASAFLLTELKAAFQLGLMLLIPFLVIDLLVANVLVLLGYAQLSPLTVSLPLKLLVFFAVDGWTLVTQRLLTSYGG